jgi:hypothetical protein
MNRAVAAFFIAPLWAPVLTPFLLAFMWYPPWPHGAWWQVPTLIAALLGYAGTALIGLPAYLLLRKTALARAPIAIGLGFIGSILTFIVFLCAAGMFLWGDDVRKTLVQFVADLSQPTGLRIVRLGTGAIGSLVGITIWAIARPRLPAARPSQFESRITGDTKD